MELNSNFLGDDGLIYNVYIGDQTLLRFEKAVKELEKLIFKVRSEGKKVLILTDISKVGDATTQVRQRGIEVIRNLDYDRVAIYAVEGVGLQIAKIIVKVSMMDYKIKIFDNKKSATNWLLGN